MEGFQVIWRIYTEDKGNIPEIVSQYFAGFTVYSAVGYWEGQREKTAVVEVVTEDEENVRELAGTIREINKQHSVLIVPISTGKKLFVI